MVHSIRKFIGSRATQKRAHISQEGSMNRPKNKSFNMSMIPSAKNLQNEKVRGLYSNYKNFPKKRIIGERSPSRSNVKLASPVLSSQKTAMILNKSLPVSKTSHGARNHFRQNKHEYFSNSAQKQATGIVKFFKPKRHVSKTSYGKFRKNPNDMVDQAELLSQENEIYDRIVPADNGLIYCSEIQIKKRCAQKPIFSKPRTNSRST